MILVVIVIIVFPYTIMNAALKKAKQWTLSAMTSHVYLITKMVVIVVGLCTWSDWRDQRNAMIIVNNSTITTGKIY